MDRLRDKMDRWTDRLIQVRSKEHLGTFCKGIMSIINVREGFYPTSDFKQQFPNSQVQVLYATNCPIDYGPARNALSPYSPTILTNVICRILQILL